MHNRLLSNIPGEKNAYPQLPLSPALRSKLVKRELDEVFLNNAEDLLSLDRITFLDDVLDDVVSKLALAKSSQVLE